MEQFPVEKAVSELKKSEERKFNQTIDLIVNLKKFDVKKTPLNFIITLPNKVKERKVCGFIESKSSIIDTIPKISFSKYKDKKQMKPLIKKYDFFISSAQNMPAVATSFGRVLGPAGKMPSPKLGIVLSDSEEEIKKLVDKIKYIARIQPKEPSIKIPIGQIAMSDMEISENIHSAVASIINELPNKKENVRSIMIKLTMSRPIKLEI
ncbi:hypothetical protein J4463_01820 [Candidatus Pacearchaeota archaeon]|nr:hypothetical protein [Candidatus Pacearchaeota archaeon]